MALATPQLASELRSFGKRCWFLSLNAWDRDTPREVAPAARGCLHILHPEMATPSTRAPPRV